MTGVPSTLDLDTIRVVISSFEPISNSEKRSWYPATLDPPDE